MSYHAKLSPSSAKRWTECTASIAAQEGLSDDGSEAARLGTCAHQLSAECLEQGADPQSYLGRIMVFYADIFDKSGEDWVELVKMGGTAFSNFKQHEVIVTQEMIDACATYINFVREQVEMSGANLYVEQRVPIGHITGEYDDGKPAGGTSDVVMTAGRTLTTVDAKFGRGKVMAYDVISPAGTDIITGEATPEVVQINLQLAFYLLGSLEKYPGDYETVKAIIVQPFLNHVSEYSCSVAELLKVGEWLKQRAEATRSAPVFAPSQDSCHFCKARRTCKAREGVVLSTALAGFDDIDLAQPAPIRVNQLGSLYEKVGMIQAWCKDVQVRVFDELQSGNQVMRNDGLQYKLVVGKKGNRGFDDEAEAEKLLKSFRLKFDEMYTSSLISPAAAEKLAKVKKGATEPPAISAKQWLKLEQRITQSEGSPTVALETDPRPAIVKAPLGFDDVPEDADDCADLF